MSPQLLVALIQLAMRMPALAKEIKDVATRSDVTDAEWEETASILATPGGTASYFGDSPPNGKLIREPLGARATIGESVTTPALGSIAKYGQLLPTDPSDADLADGDKVYSITTADPRGGARVEYFVVAADDANHVLPASAVLVREVGSLNR